jgi:hypothetical protein
VLRARLDVLFTGKSFLYPQLLSTGLTKPIATKPHNKDQEIALSIVDHMPYAAIAEVLLIPIRRISTSSKSITSGELAVKHKPPGRPSKITSEIISQVRHLISVDPYLDLRPRASQIAGELGISIFLEISNSIRKMLLFTYQLPPKYAPITKKQQPKRVEFCMKSLVGDIG